MEAKNKIIATVEIGTSKTVTLIAQIDDNKTLRLIGHGHSTSRGVVKGEILGFEQVTNTLHASMLAAEKSAQVPIDPNNIYLSVAGNHLKGFFNHAQIQVSNAENIVSDEDRLRLMEEAKRKELPPNRVYVNRVGSPIYLDGTPTPNPVGLVGKSLAVKYWLITGEEKKLRVMARALNAYGFRGKDIFCTALVVGDLLSSEEEKKEGCLVIDIGAGTTDFILYQKGVVVHTDSLPLGGDHLTNDLAIGLRTNYKQAEDLKCRIGKAIEDRCDRNETVMLSENFSIGNGIIRRHAVNQILHNRILEIFQVITQKMGDKWNPNQHKGGIILTGGTAKLDKIEKAAQDFFGVSVRPGILPNWIDSELRIPEYSTVMGVLNYVFKDHTSKDKTPSRSSSTNLLKRVANFADRIFNL